MIKILVGAALAVSITAVAARPDYSFHDQHSVSKTLRFAGAGIQTLDVRTINGSIRVTGDDASDVRVEATQTIDAETQEALRAAQREVVLDTVDNATTIEISVRELDRALCGESGIERSRAWWDRRRYEVTYDVTIRVPKATRLRLCTINGQEIHVGGTSGDFDITNVNGPIAMKNVRGSGRAATVNGRVTASFDEAPQTASLFKTVNGDVTVTFPAALSADLKMKTFNGGLFTDFDVELLPQRTTTAERQGGKFVYRSNRFTSVRVRRGGPELTFESLNGDVRVLRSAK
jgi:DUF4097 and DUF4098 domain-containing protein YvlB